MIPVQMPGAALSPADAEGLKRFAAMIDEGNRPLSLLCSLVTRLRLDPQTWRIPSGLFYRAVSEVAYSRYGLKGTIHRAFLGEALRPDLAVNFVMCARNVQSHAEQAEPFFDWLGERVPPEKTQMVNRMVDLFQQERVNFARSGEFLRRLLGAEAWKQAEDEVLRAAMAGGGYS
jgi:hypothetical protein